MKPLEIFRYRLVQGWSEHRHTSKDSVVLYTATLTMWRWRDDCNRFVYMYTDQYPVCEMRQSRVMDSLWNLIHTSDDAHIVHDMYFHLIHDIREAVRSSITNERMRTL